jgi:hypothetical protein
MNQGTIAARLRTFVRTGTMMLGLSAITGVGAAGGCARYYEVTDPTSGKAYYTRDVDHRRLAGYVKFKDAKSGSRVTLQSSQVRKISEAEYVQGLAK